MFSLMYVSVRLNVSVHHRGVVSKEASRGCQIPLDWSYSPLCEPPCRRWESNLVPREEQPMLLITEPSIVQILTYFKVRISLCGPSRPGTHCVDQNGFECTEIALLSGVKGLHHDTLLILTCVVLEGFVILMDFLLEGPTLERVL